ncbi:5866_t:CDS:1, partial [Gigaspora rosea]
SQNTRSQALGQQGTKQRESFAEKKAILDLHANKNMREDGEGKENERTVPDFIESIISSLMGDFKNK